LVAEFVGTFTLVFIGAGSIIAVGAAGGGTGGAGLVTIAIAHGLAFAVMVSALGHVSGGHFNPAITIGLWVVRKVETATTVAYIVAQLAGGIAAAAVLRGALPGASWRAAKLGATLVSGIGNGRAVVIEAVLSFFLIWVVIATAVDPDGAFNKVAGLAIGFVLIMDIMMGGPFTGAAMNPARSFGPALVGNYWTGEWVYWVGPVAGGIVAAVLYNEAILIHRTPS